MSVFVPHPPLSPNERGYRVPAGPGRLKGPRSPVSEPTWGSNYPSAGPLRDAPPAGRSSSNTLDSHSWVCGRASIIREAPEPGCHVARDEGDATGSAQRALAPVARYWRKRGRLGAKLSGGEEEAGRWKRRGFDRKRNELSAGDK